MLAPVEAGAWMRHDAQMPTFLRRCALVAALLLTLFVALVPPTAAAGCEFVLGFAVLRDLITEAEGPEKVGDCLEDQRFAANGDALQQTTGGLLAWRKLADPTGSLLPWRKLAPGRENGMASPGRPFSLV